MLDADLASASDLKAGFYRFASRAGRIRGHTSTSFSSSWEHCSLGTTDRYCERFVQTIKQECLDHFVIVGECQLNYVVREFLLHYHHERPHQGLGNVSLSGMPPVGEGHVECRERLGGLLNHYERVAA